ncbi:MAG: lipopolysaccharide/colanic/teichoic acid biosynthesis glycosyltransferase [Candidatus Azotimanducaceae bacterium]|jgi:lipopolysaccharide/colanic/teichoic acid biosynthesis glycosyltransferase
MSYTDPRGIYGQFMKRAVDVIVSLVALAVTSPILLLSGLGIKIASPGPVFYKARRAGKHGRVFSMLKFRTMHVGSDKASAITAPSDQRVFRFGVWLRRLKIDEIPQFWNILTGEMSLVGPRPEDPKIVQCEYKDWMYETLLVSPGVTGPGSVYGYIFGDALLEDADPEGSYTRNLLPPKLALERAYMERAGFMSDLGYLLLTVRAIFAHIFRRDIVLPKQDIEGAGKWVPDLRPRNPLR